MEKYVTENSTMENLYNSDFKTFVDIFTRCIGESYIRNMLDMKWDISRDEGYYMEGFPCIVKIDETKVFPP